MNPRAPAVVSQTPAPPLFRTATAKPAPLSPVPGYQPSPGALPGALHGPLPGALHGALHGPLPETAVEVAKGIAKGMVSAAAMHAVAAGAKGGLFPGAGQAAAASHFPGNR